MRQRLAQLAEKSACLVHRWSLLSARDWGRNLHTVGQDAIAFQAEIKAVQDRVTSHRRKRLVKEQITICTDSQAAVTILAASGTKSLLVADCIEKVTALLEVYQVTIMWVPGHNGGSVE